MCVIFEDLHYKLVTTCNYTKKIDNFHCELCEMYESSCYVWLCMYILNNIYWYISIN